MRIFHKNLRKDNKDDLFLTVTHILYVRNLHLRTSTEMFKIVRVITNKMSSETQSSASQFTANSIFNLSLLELLSFLVFSM